MLLCVHQGWCEDDVRCVDSKYSCPLFYRMVLGLLLLSSKGMGEFVSGSVRFLAFLCRKVSFIFHQFLKVVLLDVAILIGSYLPSGLEINPHSPDFYGC